MRRIGILCVVPLLAGCDALVQPCLQTSKEDGFSILSYVGDRECYRLSEPVLMRGIWHNEFEGSRFFANVQSVDGLPVEPKVWLQTHELLSGPQAPLQDGKFYRVEFVGRQPLLSWSKLMSPGYGHLGMSNGLVVVDHFTAISQIDPSDQRERSEK